MIFIRRFLKCGVPFRFEFATSYVDTCTYSTRLIVWLNQKTGELGLLGNFTNEVLVTITVSTEKSLYDGCVEGEKGEISCFTSVQFAHITDQRATVE
jgi:hypothetical protein